jgi:tRNA(fMet)-specific endonuclease VapC
MEAMIDASALIEWKKGNPKVAKVMEKMENISISSLTQFEFMVGIGKEDEATSLFLKEYPLVPFDAIDSVRAVDIYRKLSGKGKMIKTVDILVAAQALNRGLTIVSTDRHFGWVDNLESITIETSKHSTKSTES